MSVMVRIDVMIFWSHL